MRASTAVNFDPEGDDGAVPEIDRTEAGAADVADAAVPELDRTEAGAADVTDCPAVTP